MSNEREQTIYRIKNGDDRAKADLHSLMGLGIELLLRRHGHGPEQAGEVFAALCEAIKSGTLDDLPSAARFAREKIKRLPSIAVSTRPTNGSPPMLEAVRRLSDTDRRAVNALVNEGQRRDRICRDMAMARQHLNALIESLKVARLRATRTGTAERRPLKVAS